MPYSKNHTEKTVEEKLSQGCNQALVLGSRLEEIYLDLLELYQTAGGTNAGLAQLLNNTASQTPEQTEFANDAIAAGAGLNNIVTEIKNNAAVLRRFS